MIYNQLCLMKKNSELAIFYVMRYIIWLYIKKNNIIQLNKKKAIYYNYKKRKIKHNK